MQMIHCFVHGIKPGEKYSENIRTFCMKQQYYSTAAYKSLRQFFNKNLPAVRTLQSWYTCIDAAPGVSGSALSILREKSESYMAENGHQLHIALMCDEMKIEKQLCFCPEKESFIGVCTMTNNKNNDSAHLELADNALVYMVVGRDFKLPVAYELLNGLCGLERAALTLKVVKSIEENNTRVMSLTSDGLAANITCAENLGAKFDEGKPYFVSPTHPEQKIYIILDAPHMLKLVRKHFASNMIYHNDQLVNWEDLEKLVIKQSSENFNLCNKLSPKHMNWHLKPMNVRLAAETISDSVADAIDQLRRDDYTEFQNSESTTEFLRFFNAAFDILNVGEFGKRDNKYRLALNKETATKIFEFAARFKKYISELELRKKTKSDPILLSTAEKGFFGFYNDFISFEGIYKDFVLNSPQFMEFYSFQFSQDHLETFFSLIR